MPRYAVVRSDGLISSITGGDPDPGDFPDRELVLCGSDICSTTHYYSDGEFIEKSPLDTKHSVVGLTVTFTKLPPGVKVVCDGGETITDGGDLEIEFDLPGEKRIYFLDAPIYKTGCVEVVVG